MNGHIDKSGLDDTVVLNCHFEKTLNSILNDLVFFHPMVFLHDSLVAQGHWAGGARICHHTLCMATSDNLGVQGRSEC